jgi:hypothetical protein
MIQNAASAAQLDPQGAGVTDCIPTMNQSERNNIAKTPEHIYQPSVIR